MDKKGKVSKDLEKEIKILQKKIAELESVTAELQVSREWIRAERDQF